MKELLKRILPESLKRRTRRWRAAGIAALASRTNLTRDPLAHIFLRGEGIEIGSLNWPLDLPRTARATYVDGWSTETLAAKFPEFAKTLLPVGIVAPIETLEGVGDASQDFVVANHVLEHSEDPIRAMRSMTRVLKVGGVLFLALPDKRYTFDVGRPLTPFEHLVEDERQGPERSRAEHYREFAHLVEGVAEGPALERRVEEMLESGGDVHFHVWTQSEMFEMLVRLRREFALDLEIEAMSKSGIEAIFVLRKLS